MITICAVFNVGANAQVEVADTTHTVLHEVEVTAAAAPRSAVSTAPMRMIDSDMLLRTGVTDVSDALHRMPGVNLRDYGGAGGLKTVSVRGFGAGHTGVFYDGVPLSDAQSGQIDLSRYSVDNVNKVSLVIGDNDDIFIPARLAASAATVNITTMAAPATPCVSVKMRAGSFGLYNPFVSAGAPLGENAAISVVGEYTHADNDYPFELRNGTVTTTERRNNSRMNSAHAEVNLYTTLSSRTSLVTKIYGYHNSRQLPGQVVVYNNTNHEHLREQNVMAQTALHSGIGTCLSIKALLKYNFALSDYSDRNGKYPGGVLDRRYRQREYYGSVSALYTLTDRWLIDYSADYFHTNLNSNRADDRRPYRNSVLQTLTAKYRYGGLTVMARMLASLYFNGTHTGASARDARKLSPSLSVAWQPWREQLLFVRASYKNIFRMPTFNEAYFDHYGSDDVLPESTDQINAGATYTLRAQGALAAATISVDGYVNNIHDMIVGVPYNMFVWRIVNLGKVRTVGLDVAADVTVTPRRGHDISLSAGYALQRAMPRTDPLSSDWMKQVAYIPRHSGSLSVSYQNPWVDVSLTGTGVSARYTTNNNLPDTRIAGYVEWSATARRTFKIGRCMLGLRADALNLLNKQYCIVARYPMPGRSFRFTLSFDY